MSQADDSAKSAATALIREAFDRARSAGKSDWQRMTTAVLNNRLLQITDGDFSIGRYGARTVVEFAQMFPDVVRVTEGVNGGPPIVTLVESRDASADERLDRTDAPARPVGRPQVREDLWRATMDWNEEHTYVIDPVTGHARLQQATDPPELTSIAGVPKQLYLQWRSEFIEDALASTSDEGDQAALTHWRDVPGPSRNLPTHLQDAWMDTLRTHVIEHIRAWFATAGLPVPTDLTRNKGTVERLPVSGPTAVAVAAQRLRDVVRRCVDQMSYDELLSLELPAGVVARTFGR